MSVFPKVPQNVILKLPQRSSARSACELLSRVSEAGAQTISDIAHAPVHEGGSVATDRCVPGIAIELFDGRNWSINS